MTLFQRRTPSKPSLPPGTRTCPTSTATVLTSSGIPSLDDILGGGVPLSSSLGILAPDAHSAYGELVQKYFVSQGIASGHRVCIVHPDALSFATECMWMPRSESGQTIDEDAAAEGEERIKIAWRYGQMKTFETTVADRPADPFCDAFDLTCRIPASVIAEAESAKRVIPLGKAMYDDAPSWMDGCAREIERVLSATPPGAGEVVRVCVAALGSPEWGEHCGADIFRFLHGLRRLLRRHAHACACVSLAPHACGDDWGGHGWVSRVGWATDASIALTTRSSGHQGWVQILRLPALHGILPTSDACSTLRGLARSAAAGGGENNIGFRCTRRGLVFETLHLDAAAAGAAARRTADKRVAFHAGLYDF